MDSFIADPILRQILLLDNLSDEKCIKHQIFPDHSNFNYFFTGPRRCGKTSLLFEYAFQAAENNVDVLFITKDKMDKLPHLINQRTQPAMKILRTIEIMYLSSLNEFFKIMSTMHLTTKKYGLVLIDDIDHFYGTDKKNEMMVISKVLAFTVDAVTFLRKLGHSTFLLVSSSVHSPLHQSTVETWFENYINFYPHHSGNGFVIKPETKINTMPNDDIVLKGLNVTLKENRILIDA